MGNNADDRLTTRDKAAEAFAKGYATEACCDCGNFTLQATAEVGILNCETCGNQQLSQNG